MTTLNITEEIIISNTAQEYMKNRKLAGIDKFIIRAKQEYDTAISKENYGIANTKYGFFEGLKSGRSYLTYCWFLNIDSGIDWADDKLLECANDKNWGKCDYWQSYISALNTCKAIIEG